VTVRARVERLLDVLPRPLDRVRSIKTKLSLVLLGSGLVGALYLWLSHDWMPKKAMLATGLLVVLTAQVLAHGMTSPLREMTAAARAMALGDYSRRVHATARDEVGELAEAFNRMAADLAAADQARRELIANVSHELRTPITALRLMLENAVDGVGARADVLPAALAETERLGQLVGDFLELSRIEAGVVTLRRERWAVADLLAETITEAEAVVAATGRGVRFELAVEPPDLTVLADRARLRQVVVNLLDNAVRHGPSDATVRVSAQVSGPSVVLEVRDEGPGIPEDQAERVFQRFSRGERAGDGGTGLGLAIARWVAELHGGRISVVPARAGEPGSAMRVELPSD
jgi:signal transduction histidine kinase